MREWQNWIEEHLQAGLDIYCHQLLPRDAPGRKRNMTSTGQHVCGRKGRCSPASALLDCSVDCSNSTWRATQGARSNNLKIISHSSHVMFTQRPHLSVTKSQAYGVCNKGPRHNTRPSIKTESGLENAAHCTWVWTALLCLFQPERRAMYDDAFPLP